MPVPAGLLADLTSSDEARAEAAVGALRRIGAAAIPDLLRLTRSASAETRWWALRALAAIPDPRSAAALAGGLEDEEQLVRQAAALGLRAQPTRQAVPGLLARLADPDTMLARLASDALASLGEPAVAGLRAALRSPEAARRIHAARALALMREKTAIPDLFAALEDESALVRHWAERGLEDLGVGMMFFAPD